jgi:hypothetical protein
MFARSGPLYGHRMRRRASVFLRNRRVQNAGDVLLALVLAEALLEKFGGDSIGELRRNIDSYRATLGRLR